MEKTNISFNAAMKQHRFEFEENKLVHHMLPLWRKYQKKRFKTCYWQAFKKCKKKKGGWKIFCELLYLWIVWRCVPYHYFRYGLYQEGFTKEEIKNYLPETVFYYRMLPILNKNYVVLDDKFITADILLANNLPAPATLLKVINGSILNNVSEIIPDDGALQSYLRSINSDKIVGKYANCGSGGHQVVIFNRFSEGFELNGKSLNFAWILENFNDWIFQEALENVDFLKTVHPSSLNTFRVMTFNDEGNVSVMYCVLKFGNNNAMTDNAHTDGIYVKVNLETRMTEGLAFDENLNCYKNHPYTLKEISDMPIPGVEELIQTAKRAALFFPEDKFIGFDIALTPNGPVIIEGNCSPGLTIIQRTHRGMKRFIEKWNCLQ